MGLKTLSDFSFRDKRVLLRIDINSPVVDGKPLDNPRFDEAAQTIKYLLGKGARLVILAHQGRKGEEDFIALKHHAHILSKKVGRKIEYCNHLFGMIGRERIASLRSGEALMMKNVREERDETELQGSRYISLANLFDIYVNDAFSVSHREQGSIMLPPQVIPSCIGLNFERELKALEKFSIQSNRKSCFIIGGAKIDDYLPLFKVLERKNNKILVSGILGNLFLVSKGVDLGYEVEWLKKNNYLRLLPELARTLERHEKQIILPLDFAIGDPKLSKTQKRIEIPLEKTPTNKKIWDVGQKTVELFKEELKGAKFIFMKGPLGYSELPIYSNSTIEMLQHVSKLSKRQAFSISGGGHLTTTLKKYNIDGNFSYNSTSGGALIAYLSGKKLPGIEALEECPHN